MACLESERQGLIILANFLDNFAVTQNVIFFQNYTFSYKFEFLKYIFGIRYF